MSQYMHGSDHLQPINGRHKHGITINHRKIVARCYFDDSYDALGDKYDRIARSYITIIIQ